MPIKVTNAGENLLLNQALKTSGGPDLLLKLFSNNYTPVDDSDSTDFTEATFTGYTPHTLTRAGWDDATTNGDGKGESVFGTAQSWDATGAGQTIHGYFVETDDTNGTVVWAERFDQARALGAGDSLTITPRLTGDSEN